MNRHLLALLLAISCLSGYAQVKFDSGYFVANDGRKTVCLIKNYDWKYNPSDFLYRQSENASIQKATITDVREFGIFNFSRYERFDVDIDTSAQQLEGVTTNAAPEFKRETVFLKVLVQGKATLYAYWGENLIRYFIKTDTGRPEQLIHKSYYSSAEQTNLLENNLFRNQLFADLHGPDLDQRDFSDLSYNDKSLTRVFERYNKTQNTVTESFLQKNNEKKFNLNLRLGADLSGLTMDETYYSGDTKTNLDSKISVTVGLEAEFIMGFNRNKWALVLGSAYGSYKSNPNASGGAAGADYKMIESTIGAREYFFLNKRSKLFATLLCIYDAPIGSGSVYYGYDTFNFTGRITAGLSAGYKYANKCSIELKYTLRRSILDNYDYVQGRLNTTSLVFGYTLF
jgi:hypothetical protein